MARPPKPMLGVAAKGLPAVPASGLLVTPKLDGVRVMVADGVAWTRSGLPLPNQAVQTFVKANAARLQGLDAEIVVGRATGHAAFQRTTSAVMKSGGAPNFTLHAFDLWNRPGVSYAARAAEVARLAAEVGGPVRPVVPVLAKSAADVARLEQSFVAAGFEGAIARAPGGLYKHGRSTLSEAGLIKLKRFADAEARIVGAVELMRAGKPAGVLGALEVERGGVKFRIGSGLTSAQRAEMWATRADLPGQTAKFKFMPHGTSAAPRHPVFLGIRSVLDMASPSAGVAPGATRLASAAVRVAARVPHIAAAMAVAGIAARAVSSFTRTYRTGPKAGLTETVRRGRP